MDRRIEATLLVDCRNTLAEGIQWHGGHERLYWTDILGRTLWSCDADGGAVEKTGFDKRVGSFAFCTDGRILTALEDELALFDPEHGALTTLAPVEADEWRTRLNDGRVDRQGRFVFGGVDEHGMKPFSAVYQYNGVRVSQLFDGVGCANGIAFSPDGARMYFADSAGKTIERISYETDGVLGARRTFATLTAEEGSPDGSCVDAEGALWNAQYNGARVQRFLPDGTRDIRVDLPVSQVTCACFGGPDLDRLYITTARENFTEDQAAAEPNAGGIFVAEVGAAFGVKGLPEERFTVVGAH